ncbi:hypothetical protein JYQ62_07950 [Nostoc sp. UHCC 0702]|nr:hypothetical protein JYQ62_07950 [Nostoc sp. UHCC 0702]
MTVSTKEKQRSGGVQGRRGDKTFHSCQLTTHLALKFNKSLGIAKNATAGFSNAIS